MTTHAGLKSTKSSSIRKKDRNCKTNVATIHSDQDNTNNHLVNGTPGLSSNLEEEPCHSEYHSIIDLKVVTGDKKVQGVITSHVKVEKRCQTKESTNLSSNHWEESYCKMEFDRSVREHDTTLVINRHADDSCQIKDKLYKDSILKEENPQMEMQKIITSKLLNT